MTLLSTTYFGPVQWYQKLYRSEHVLLEQHESFIKQTYRNRCVIATANGTQTLSVPVEHGTTLNIQQTSVCGGSLIKPGLRVCRHRRQTIRDIRISNHGNWRHLHWNALLAAYGESPFFDYYIDDLRPFFERSWDFLFDLNLEITHKMCELLDIQPQISLTKEYNKAPLHGVRDYRDVIRPKHPLQDDDFQPRPYYQVFRHRHGFLPNMSILDLLFNMGNEAILYL